MSGEAGEVIRVLYIEDEKVLRDLVADFLKALGGYEVECAINGQEGLEKAKSWKPHFILIDVRMPTMDGPEAIRILRKMPETAKTPIYVLTAYSDEKTLAVCEEAGADGYFTKPPSYILINSTIKKVLNQRRQDASGS